MQLRVRIELITKDLQESFATHKSNFCNILVKWPTILDAFTEVLNVTN